MGNLNVTVFTNRQQCDYKENLTITCAALNEKWKLDLLIKNRRDIILKNNRKVRFYKFRCAVDIIYVL